MNGILFFTSVSEVEEPDEERDKSIIIWQSKLKAWDAIKAKHSRREISDT